MFPFEERTFALVVVLVDGRFAFICEESMKGSLDSKVEIEYKILLASSLQLLLFFGLGDNHRRMLGIVIGAEQQLASTSPSVCTYPQYFL